MALLCLALSVVQVYALFLYPLFQTYKQVRGDGQKQKLWAYFWVVFTAISLFEIPTCALIKMIPCAYSTLKAVLFVWLYHESTQGALLIGDKFKPQFQVLVEKTKPIQDKLAAFIE